MTGHPLQSWIPYKLSHKEGAISCHWLNTFDKPFTEPFFDETIAACKGRYPAGIYRESVSDLNMLTDWASAFEDMQPSAFIFHISRCGSTLVSQLLGISEEHISLAEVPLFDDILRLPFKTDKYSEVQITSMLKAALKFYGQSRTGKEKRLFIKTDSWHILFYNRLRALYPFVPFFLLYRKPDEVLYSHTKLRGVQAVPGLIEPEVFGFENRELVSLSLDEYTAKVLERYYMAYRQVAENDSLSFLVNYRDGVIPIVELIAFVGHFSFSEGELLEINSRVGYHSKHPGEAFKEEEPGSVPLFLKTAFELYFRLEKRRLFFR